MKRREAITKVGGVMALGVAGMDLSPLEASVRAAGDAGRLKQRACRWCYAKIPLDDLCAAARRIGLQSVELLGEKEWDVPAKHGLTCAMANGP